MTGKRKRNMTNITNTFSMTETTGGIPTPPEDLPEYDSYQDLIDMEVKPEEQYEKKQR